MYYATEMGSGIHTKFHTDWFRHSEVDKGRGDSQTHRQQGNHISLIFFSK
jgi:hypothetical protein